MAFNWNDTNVSNRGATIDDSREREIEEVLPEFRTTATIAHRFDTLDGLVRINHYSEVFEALFNDAEGLPVVTSSLVLVIHLPRPPSGQSIRPLLPGSIRPLLRRRHRRESEPVVPRGYRGRRHMVTPLLASPLLDYGRITMIAFGAPYLLP